MMVKEQLEWRKAYELGCGEIDRQHKYLFDLAMEVEEAQPHEGMQYAEKLFDSASRHFRDEERHMEENGYPELETHIKTHQKMIWSLNVLMQDGVNSREGLDRLVAFFAKWIRIHILKEDMQYVKFHLTERKS